MLYLSTVEEFINIPILKNTIYKINLKISKHYKKEHIQKLYKHKLFLQHKSTLNPFWCCLNPFAYCCDFDQNFPCRLANTTGYRNCSHLLEKFVLILTL